MLLRQLLTEIESERGPIHLAELGRRLQVEPSALEGMIAFWVRKGRLRVDQDAACVPASAHCGAACAGSTTCAFIAKMPKAYLVAPVCPELAPKADSPGKNDTQ